MTDSTIQNTLIYCRKTLYDALESGRYEQIGLRREFITSFPRAGRYGKTRVRYPFDDNVARALADEANLRSFAEDHDPRDRGLRDVWETLVYTGRRCSEVLQLQVDCIGHYGGAALLWHDQTKVGNLDAGIRIPDYLYQRLDERRSKTLVRFERRQGRNPSVSERAAMALFPTHVRNPAEDKPISYGLFHTAIKSWVAGLDLGGCVPHQARHTLATKLLAAGATLTHIRKYLGHVSERMAEHYIKVGVSEIDDVLARVWVAGPGSASPGKPLTSNAQPLDREQAEAMAVDVGRRCTPTLGGLCTLQVVVDGGRCPRNLDCDNCDKLVMTGADLLYWRREREQWYSIAERAPDEATAAYLHAVFEPSARAIDGLEKVLAGLGLLEQALALDLRRPQDYFGHMWSTGFPVDGLAAAGSQADAVKHWAA